MKKSLKFAPFTVFGVLYLFYAVVLFEIAQSSTFKTPDLEVAYYAVVIALGASGISTIPMYWSERDHEERFDRLDHTINAVADKLGIAKVEKPVKKVKYSPDGVLFVYWGAVLASAAIIFEAFGAGLVVYLSFIFAGLAFFISAIMEQTSFTRHNELMKALADSRQPSAHPPDPAQTTLTAKPAETTPEVEESK